MVNNMNCFKEKIVGFGVFLISFAVLGQNPIVANQGLNDPHIHIFDNKAYVYASHDTSIDNKGFLMEDWWIWSSPDLVNWKKESVLKPEHTYIGKPFTQCWATDVAYKNGKYYWYFSEGNEQTGVVVGDSPVGPWKDVLGKPLLTSDMTPTHEYDIGLIEDNGNHYIIFGVWDYYIAKLNDDMISLAEKPRKLEINNPRGPYNLDGKNLKMPTDDKPFMHKHNGKFYLSWGIFYAMSDSVYGPFDYKDQIMKKESFAQGFDSPTWPHGFQQGRHGSFFEWHNQTYFAYCDISQTGNRYFRDTFISYIHYKANGEIATIRVDGIGVGNYNANESKIEAEDYFDADGVQKVELKENDFAIQTLKENSYIGFTNIKNLKDKKAISFKIASDYKTTFEIEIRKESLNGKVVGNYKFKTKGSGKLEDLKCELNGLSDKETLYFKIKTPKNEQITINSFSFLK
ncbi:family 43 glycosylhydrolase [Flavobacterium sp. NG2]|uniref:family 43 glycosylhydrolase n=1 Tax=Flavobacterium sp. NG2 TaxID=3097547 RepID=UPI002A82EE55|nr:family 43 glycosylhydrolase [Flavobacterium sp. NG2]WPR70102.1 family 43 glycosylhydrolase [Flavobacterium sp. NG2]